VVVSLAKKVLNFGVTLVYVWMSIPTNSHGRVRFQDFELDLQTAELTRNGIKVALQHQSFQVLAVLSQRPGELITRDELKKALWASDTFVDFDHSLNKAVNRLRAALSDSSEEPQYIETLPRLGYRFIAGVDATPSWVEVQKSTGVGGEPGCSVILPRTAYQRIQQLIRNRIEAGQLRPGDAVASERELARIHQVSLMTARHALQSLKREGLVERRRGVGAFVATPKIHFNKLMSYTEQMASRGLSARSKIVYSGLLSDEPEIAARLSLSPTSALVKIERVRLAADQPFALEASYLSAEKFSGMVDAPLERSSLFDTLEQNYGIELAYSDDEIDSTAADTRVATQLDVPRGTPLLRIRQLICTTTGTPAIYVQGLYLWRWHTLVVRRFR
jgi:GntR family transcriptional regulator